MLPSRHEQLVNWMIDEYCGLFGAGKYRQSAKYEVLKSMGVEQPDLGLWSETTHQEALAYFRARYRHD